ncbi:MAG: response regulator transcription factor [Amphritea sp.]
MQNTKQVLIADRSPLYREGIKQILDATGIAAAVTETACYSEFIAEQLDVHSAERLTENSFDLIILEPGALYPKNRSAKYTSRHRQTNTVFTSPVLLLADNIHLDLLYKARAKGIHSIASKAYSSDKLKRIFEQKLSGKTYWPKAPSKTTCSDYTNVDKNAVLNGLPYLTCREKTVLSHLKEGLMNKQIGYQMGIQENTVKTHVSRILGKLQISNRTKLIITLQSHACSEQYPS